MANVQYQKDENGNPKKNGDGTITFRLRVFLSEDVDGGQEFRSTSWRAPAGMRFSTALKRAQEEAVLFEDSVKGNPNQQGRKVLFSELAVMYEEDAVLRQATKACAQIGCDEQ